MPQYLSRLRTLSICVGICALLPATAMAGTTETSTLSGVVGSELSVAVDTPPPPMTLGHAADGMSTAALAIVSTTPWTLKIHDASATTPGRMDQVDCVTGASMSGGLLNPLRWANALDSSKSGSLSATPATVATGSGPDAASVLFTQALGASENVSAAECYQLTATWTIS